jgi:hypothetical protein
MITIYRRIHLEDNPNTTHKPGRKKRILIIVASILLLAISAIAIVGGATILYLNMGTDSEGYALSESYSIKTPSNAFALWALPMRVTGIFSRLDSTNFAATKWVISSTEPTQEIFVGWAKASDVEPYIRGFRYETPDEFWHWQTAPYAPEIDIPSTAIFNQGSPARPPSEEGFWLKTAATTNSTAIYWDPVWDSNEGMKVVVIMNTDGSSNVNASLQLGFKVPILTWLPYVLIPLGILFLFLGLLLFKRRKSQ